MPGTNTCFCCNGGCPKYYIFLRGGMFANKTYIDDQMIKYLETNTSIWNEVKKKLSKPNSRGHQLFVCTKCRNTLLDEDPDLQHILGFLTKDQHAEYRKCSKYAKELHTDGFAVVEKGDADIFPLGELLDLCKKNEPASLTADTDFPKRGMPNKWARAWIQFKKLNNNNNHWKELGNSLGKYISPDIHFGRLAIYNRDCWCWKGEGVPPRRVQGNDIAYAPSGQSVLYRDKRLISYQMPHVDAHMGAFNCVTALTNNYRIKVWRGSHFLKPGVESRQITGNGSTLCLGYGEILIFHSNLIHNGMESCGDANNFTKLRNQFVDINEEMFKSIKWFGVGKKYAQRKHISDFSIHFTLDFTMGRHSAGDFPTGKIKVDRIDWLSPHTERGGNKEEFKRQSREIVRAYREEIRENSLRFEEMKKMGNDIDVLVPCGQLIADVHNAFNVFASQVTYPQRSAVKRKRTETGDR